MNDIAWVIECINNMVKKELGNQTNLGLILKQLNIDFYPILKSPNISKEIDVGVGLRLLDQFERRLAKLPHPVLYVDVAKALIPSTIVAIKLANDSSVWNADYLLNEPTGSSVLSNAIRGFPDYKESLRDAAEGQLAIAQKDLENAKQDFENATKHLAAIDKSFKEALSSPSETNESLKIKTNEFKEANEAQDACERHFQIQQVNVMKSQNKLNILKRENFRPDNKSDILFLNMLEREHWAALGNLPDWPQDEDARNKRIDVVLQGLPKAQSDQIKQQVLLENIDFYLGEIDSFTANTLLASREGSAFLLRTDENKRVILTMKDANGTIREAHLNENDLKDIGSEEFLKKYQINMEDQVTREALNLMMGFVFEVRENIPNHEVKINTRMTGLNDYLCKDLSMLSARSLLAGAENGSFMLRSSRGAYYLTIRDTETSYRDIKLDSVDIRKIHNGSFFAEHQVNILKLMKPGQYARLLSSQRYGEFENQASLNFVGALQTKEAFEAMQTKGVNYALRYSEREKEYCLIYLDKNKKQQQLPVNANVPAENLVAAMISLQIPIQALDIAPQLSTVAETSKTTAPQPVTTNTSAPSSTTNKAATPAPATSKATAPVTQTSKAATPGPVEAAKTRATTTDTSSNSFNEDIKNLLRILQARPNNLALQNLLHGVERLSNQKELNANMKENLNSYMTAAVNSLKFTKSKFFLFKSQDEILCAQLLKFAATHDLSLNIDREKAKSLGYERVVSKM